MKHKKPPVPVIVVLIIALAVGGYYGIKALTSNGTTQLLVSGTIEATAITISPEMTGKVIEVYVEEGAEIRQGDLLFRLDDSLLQAQREVLSAGLESAIAASRTAAAARDVAQANYTLALNAARVEAAASRTSDWSASALPGYTLPAGYFSREEMIAAAQQEISTANQLADDARNAYDQQISDPANSDFEAAEQRLLAARSALQTAQDVLTRARLSTNLDLQITAQDLFDTARTEIDAAQLAYDELKDSEGARAIIATRSNLAVWEEQLASARDRLMVLQVGEASPKLIAAYAIWNQAELAASQAENAVRQAEAQLDLIDLQIEKVRILAPDAGVILTRSIEPGEMVSAAASALMLGNLDNLTITVYVPEDIYGSLLLGQKAALTVDSYPGETFYASILHIADQAEFTPRNVQTVEGRKATVFAVRLQIEDSGGKLKPGMPADITFDE